MTGPETQTTGLDGYSEDDVPMMRVGPPTQTHPDQLTSKPRQMPSGGAPAPGMADPAEGGLDEGLEGLDGEEPAEPEGGEEPTPDPESIKALTMMASKALYDNPTLTPRQAVDLAGDVFIFMGGAWDQVGDGAWTRKIDRMPVGNVWDHKPYTDPVKERVKDQGLAFMDRAKDRALNHVNRWWQNRHPQSTGEPQPPHDPGGPDPQPNEAPPRTVGDFVQQQMKANPGNHEVRNDLWKQRFSDEPLHPDPTPGDDDW